MFNLRKLLIYYQAASTGEDKKQILNFWKIFNSTFSIAINIKFENSQGVSRPSSAFLSSTNLDVSSSQTTIFNSQVNSQVPSKSQTPRPSSRNPENEKSSNTSYNYELIKKEMLQNGEILQSLRHKLTNENQPFESRLQLVKEYLLADLLGCSTPSAGIFRKRIF